MRNVGFRSLVGTATTSRQWRILLHHSTQRRNESDEVPTPQTPDSISRKPYAVDAGFKNEACKAHDS